MNRRKLIAFPVGLALAAVLTLSCAPPAQNSVNNGAASANNSRNTAPSPAREARISEVKPANEEEAKAFESRAKEVAATELKEEKSAAAASAVAEVCYRWPTPWRHGDCTLAGPVSPGGETGPLFCIRSNGTGVMRSRGLSTDDDDEYLMRFEGLDANGAVLFNVPARSGPFILWWKLEIPNPGNWYDFNQDFTFPAGQYGSVRSVRPFAGC